MQTETLAHKLGFTTPVSRLREVAKRFGLVTEDDLVEEAVARGCFHFMQRLGHPPAQRVAESDFSNEELAIALLSIANRYEPWLIRVGAMLLGHPGNEAEKLAHLAVSEQSEAVVREIASAGARYEPQTRFWSELLSLLPEAEPLKSGVMPHHTRFVSIPGLIGPKTYGLVKWLRPQKPAGLGYAA
ncbi:MAG: hypothetical protein HS117_11220 [Verrucomicrobiaceae bacterium]|nr:hypothetical protein [Verrucomicrobiaceae bacterium]